MRIYLLRHEMRFTNPQFDTQLTKIGKLNAKKLVKLLENLNLNSLQLHQKHQQQSLELIIDPGRMVLKKNLKI